MFTDTAYVICVALLQAVMNVALTGYVNATCLLCIRLEEWKNTKLLRQSSLSVSLSQLLLGALELVPRCSLLRCGLANIAFVILLTDLLFEIIFQSFYWLRKLYLETQPFELDVDS
jgi:hypothetical protein